MSGMFAVKRSFFSFLLKHSYLNKQLVEVFHSKLFEDMIALREIIAADKSPAGFVIINAGE